VVMPELVRRIQEVIEAQEQPGTTPET
jgi:hypothetical protein